MDSTNASSEVAHDFSPLINVHKDGKVERLRGTDIIPPSLDPKTNVDSKDVVYSLENNLFARLYLSKNTNQNQKLPLLVYFHGGGFCTEEPQSIPFLLLMKIHGTQSNELLPMLTEMAPKIGSTVMLILSECFTLGTALVLIFF